MDFVPLLTWSKNRNITETRTEEEDQCSVFPWNVGSATADYMVWHPRRHCALWFVWTWNLAWSYLLNSAGLQLLRSSLVNNRTQAVVCDDLGMISYALYSNPKVELKTKDRADLLEAFLGALYVDKVCNQRSIFSWSRCYSFQNWRPPLISFFVSESVMALVLACIFIQMWQPSSSVRKGKACLHAFGLITIYDHMDISLVVT